MWICRLCTANTQVVRLSTCLCCIAATGWWRKHARFGLVHQHIERHIDQAMRWSPCSDPICSTVQRHREAYGSRTTKAHSIQFGMSVGRRLQLCLQAQMTQTGGMSGPRRTLKAQSQAHEGKSNLNLCCGFLYCPTSESNAVPLRDHSRHPSTVYRALPNSSPT